MNDLKGIIEDCNKSDLVSNKVINKVREIIGQEEWNDLYDENSDICTTMGELIITLKGIPDLEKENTKLKEIHKDVCEALTEAKRLLAMWVDDRPYTVSEQKDLIADTEQFLEELKNV